MLGALGLAEIPILQVLCPETFAPELFALFSSTIVTLLCAVAQISCYIVFLMFVGKQAFFCLCVPVQKADIKPQMMFLENSLEEILRS